MQRPANSCVRVDRYGRSSSELHNRWFPERRVTPHPDLRPPGSDMTSNRSGIGTVYATGAGGRDGEAPGINFLTTNETVSVFAGLQPAQRPFHSHQFFPAPPRCFQRHLLRLHGVHSGEPSDTGLIQYHWPRRSLRCILKLAKLGGPSVQLPSDRLQVCVRHSSNPKKPRNTLQTEQGTVAQSAPFALPELTDKFGRDGATSQPHDGPEDHGASSERHRPLNSIRRPR